MRKTLTHRTRQGELSGDDSNPLRPAGSDTCDFRQPSATEAEETYRLWSRRVLLFYASILTILVILLSADQFGSHRSDVTSIDRATGTIPPELPNSGSPPARSQTRFF
jgi:hypothetical protein